MEKQDTDMDTDTDADTDTRMRILCIVHVASLYAVLEGSLIMTSQSPIVIVSDDESGDGER